jgi:hypothetical protein
MSGDQSTRENVIKQLLNAWTALLFHEICQIDYQCLLLSMYEVSISIAYT